MNLHKSLEKLIRSFVSTIVAVLSGGTLYSDKLKGRGILVSAATIVAILSAIYLVRGALAPKGVYPASFDVELCMAEARSENSLYLLDSKFGKFEVSDFRQRAEVISHSNNSRLIIESQSNFQIFFDPSQSYFVILLVLMEGKETPQTAANSAASFLQEAMCLKKADICRLNYEIGAPRATNVNYPELSGKTYQFNFCS